MGTIAKATFEVKIWDEKPYPETNAWGGAKFARVNVTKTFHGDIEGEGTLEYFMLYPGNGTATFIGLERVVGRLGARSGSFTLQHSGTNDLSTVSITLSIVPGTGTFDLMGISGQGSSIASWNDSWNAVFPMTLDYHFLI